MSALPIDIWLQLLHERSFCAVPVADLIAAPSTPAAAAPRRRARTRTATAAGTEEDSDRARRRTLSLADILMQQAHDVLAQEDRARAARRAAGGDGAGEADLDDEDTFCDEETCRNTAINALTGAGVEVTEAAIARKMQAHRERERAAVENVRMQRAIDMLLTQLVESQGRDDEGEEGGEEDDDDMQE